MKVCSQTDHWAFWEKLFYLKKNKRVNFCKGNLKIILKGFIKIKSCNCYELALI